MLTPPGTVGQRGGGGGCGDAVEMVQHGPGGGAVGRRGVTVRRSRFVGLERAASTVIAARRSSRQVEAAPCAVAAVDRAVIDATAAERALVEEMLREAMAAGDRERVSQLGATLTRLAQRDT